MNTFEKKLEENHILILILIVILLIVQVVLSLLIVSQNNKISNIFQFTDESEINNSNPPLIELANPDDDPFLGSENPEIQIIEFIDFQCPYCMQMDALLNQIIADYPYDISLVVRDYPLDSHPLSREIAEIASCANEKDYFWQFKELLFANQNEINSLLDLNAFLEELPNNVYDMEFKKCVEERKYKTEVENDIIDAESYGVNAVPTIFINKFMLVGPMEDDVRNLIDSLLFSEP